MGFTKLKVHPKLVDGLKQMGITIPTPIQEKCIPPIKDGKDVVGQSLTGSGKTAAFGLPILEKIVPGAGLQALVLTPTRELCVQVRDNLEMMGRFLPINIISIYGGVGYFDQTEGLKIAEIVVATPGRLLDHIGRRNTDFRQIKYVVLDEADKMFEMGFEEDVSRILSQTPHNRQTILFSATMPKAAQNVVRKYLKNPVYIQEKLHVDKSLLKQVFYDIRRDDKFSLLVLLLKQKKPGPAIVFCGTKREVDRIARNLRKQRIDAMPVHGDLTQNQRQRAVDLFKKAKIDVLVATDVASRGLDIKDVTHVYNYDVPRVPEDYTHRIGRTARAGKKGDAVTLLSERDYENFDKILRQKKFEILQEQPPHFERIIIQKHHFGEGEEDYSRHERGHGSNRREERPHHRGERRDYRPEIRHSQHQRPNRHNEGNQYNHRNSYQSAPEHQYSHQRQRPPHNLQHRQQVHHPRHEERPNTSRNESYNTQPRREEHHFGPERTPRTPQPLFPSSHYNPHYKRNTPDTHSRLDSQRNNVPFYKKNKKKFHKHKRF
jgi:ATP-dependent RNA helicase DeaD